VKEATGFWLWLLRWVGHWAVTPPWGTIYCVPDQLQNQQLLAHEQVHLTQIKRDGAWRYAIKSIYYALRYSRADNPYEAEARSISGLE
jgi:hypothetical protein